MHNTSESFRAALTLSPVRLIAYLQIPIKNTEDNQEHITLGTIRCRLMLSEPDLSSLQPKVQACRPVSPARPASICHCSAAPQYATSTVTRQPLPFIQSLLAARGRRTKRTTPRVNYPGYQRKTLHSCVPENRSCRTTMMCIYPYTL